MTFKGIGGMRKSVARSVGAGAVLIALLATPIGPASAAYSDCPSGYHCWFSGTGGAGSRWQVAGTNANLSGYGISTQSGFNNGTSGLWNCGYYGTGYGGGTSTKTAWKSTHSYSARAVNSNKWIPANGSCQA